MLHAQGLTFDDRPMTLSYRQPESWTKVSPDDASPPSLWISLGDPVAGPAVQLGICAPMPQKFWLDTHHHATDQLRAVIQGSFLLQRKHMRSGDFGYQVSGVPYREGLAEGGEDSLWMFAVSGDRRGAPSTLTRHDGSFELGEVGEDQLDRPVPSVDDPYWHNVPGGAKGVSALAVSEGRTVGGFHWGNFDDAQDWRALAPGVRACAGLLGDAVAGPMIVTIRAEPGARILPGHVARSELVIVPVAGSVHLGPSPAEVGDIHIIPNDAAIAPLIAGADGADLIYMIADRRAVAPMFADLRSDHPAVAEILSLADALTVHLREHAWAG